MAGYLFRGQSHLLHGLIQLPPTVGTVSFLYQQVVIETFHGDLGLAGALQGGSGKRLEALSSHLSQTFS